MAEIPEERRARASSSWYLFYADEPAEFNPLAVIEVDSQERALERDPDEAGRHVFLNCHEIRDAPDGTIQEWYYFEGYIQDMSDEEFAQLVESGKIIPIVER
jgi:hypothetical protein